MAKVRAERPQLAAGTETSAPRRVPDVKRTTCCVVGGGPGGAVLALLLARRDVDVTLLEAHPDFDYFARLVLRRRALPAGGFDIDDQNRIQFLWHF